MLKIDFKTIVENSPEAFVILDRSGTILYSNRSIFLLLGFTSDEISGRNIMTLLPEAAHGHMRSRLQVPATGESVPHRYLLDMISKSGEKKTCDVVTSLFQTREGEERIMAFLRDMTEMVALERRCAAERDKLLNLVTESTSIVMILDKELVVTLANRGFKERLGYPEKEIVGRKISDMRIVDLTVVEAMKKISAHDHYAGRRGMESFAWTREGAKVFVTWFLSPVKETDGNVSGVLAIGHDITAKFQLEELFRLTSKMLEIEHDISLLTSTAKDSRLMMEKALDLIMRMYGHDEGYVMQSDSTGEKALITKIGTKLIPEEIGKWLSGRTDELYEPAYFPEDEDTEGLEQFANGMRSLVLLPLRGKEQAIGYICIGSGKQISLSQNEKDAMVGVISMLGYAYENIGLAESLRKSKEQLSLYNDILLHDITNYLVPMKAYLDLIKQSDCNDNKRREYLDHVASSDAALNEFVQDVKLLMFVKNTKANILTSVTLLDDLNNAIDVSISRYEGAVVDLLVSNEDKNIKVRADSALYHLFTNLITNAIKHSMPKPVVVRVMCESQGMVKVSVEDEGPGIPDDKKGMVFERGFSEPTGKVAKSTGIGLSIVSALVQKYNGKVRVEDRVPLEPERGASFVVELQLDVAPTRD
ncbi:MAG: PAS domain S-box protein [Methanomassiliicoccales archaeon]|jgi:PAS domain S-box-containing protein